MGAGSREFKAITMALKIHKFHLGHIPPCFGSSVQRPCQTSYPSPSAHVRTRPVRVWPLPGEHEHHTPHTTEIKVNIRVVFGRQKMHEKDIQ